MKVAIHTDQHYGVRNDNPIFYNIARKNLDKFIDTCAREKVEQVFLLGDLVDRRKYLNQRTLAEVHYFFRQLTKLKVPVHIIPGNHDSYLRDSLEYNWPFELHLREVYDFVHLYDEGPKEVDDILFVPWICEENEERCFNAIKDTKARICLGHFELNGFSFYRGGAVCSDGHDSSLLNRFDLVLSGHFHAPSRRANVCYVGAANAYTWSDYGDKRGFSILETESLALEFFENEHSPFKVLEYDESGPDPDPRDFRDCFVKIIAKKKSDPGRFDKVVKAISGVTSQTVSVIDESLVMSEGDVEGITVDEVVDTSKFLDKYVDALETELDKDTMKRTLQQIHSEAVALDL